MLNPIGLPCIVYSTFIAIFRPDRGVSVDRGAGGGVERAGTQFNTLKNITKILTKILTKVQFEKEICINY